MLFIDPKEVEVLPAKDGIVCEHCKERGASWKMEPKGGGERVPLCGWCVLYGGSEWGHLNRDDLVWSGRYVRGIGMSSGGKNVVVPTLDERHRLSPLDAEKYVIGIMFTSKMLARGGSMGRLVRSTGAKVVNLFGGGDD